jgi:hypothetical protein
MAIFSRKSSEEVSHTEDNAKHSTWDQPSDLGDTDLLSDSEITMSMEEIDQLFDEDELNRLLNEDVDDFIRSSDFQELLDVDELDDILNLTRRVEDRTGDKEVLQQTAEDIPEEEETVLDSSKAPRFSDLVFERHPSKQEEQEQELPDMVSDQPEENKLESVWVPDEDTVSVHIDIPEEVVEQPLSDTDEEQPLPEIDEEHTLQIEEIEEEVEQSELDFDITDDSAVEVTETAEVQTEDEDTADTGKRFKLEITQEVAAAVLAPEPPMEEPEEELEIQTEETADELEEVEAVVPVKTKKRYAVLGLILTLMAVVGLIALGIWGYHFAKGLLNQTDAKEEFNNIVYPLVVVDVPEFDSPDKLDGKVVVAAGIWNFLMNESNMDKYEKDEMGNLTVPAVDIEVYIRQLFGSKVQIEHQQVSDFEFYYDPETEIYQIPASPQVLPYAPSVQSVVHTGSDYTVVVGYVLPGPFWNVGEYAVNGDINKTMIYHYQKDENGNYIIQSVERDANQTVSGTEDDVSYPDGYAQEDESGLTEESTVSEEEDTSSESSDTDSSQTSETSSTEE